MRLFKYFIAGIFLTVFFSCKKNNDTTSIEPVFYFVNGGTGNLDKTLILFSSSDTITYNAVISPTYYLTSGAALVKIAAADQYRDSYNSLYGTSYAAMPAGSYSFKDTITATASSVYDTIPVMIYKHLLASNKEYMLPLQIIEAGNYKIDSSSSVIYLHTSNSALSGLYNSTGVKTLYNGVATDNDISSVDSFSLAKKLIPAGIINNASYLDYADLGPNGWQYIIGFSREDSSFFALPNDIILHSVQAGSFKVLAASFDSITNDIYIKSSYKNSGGNDRIVEESLTLQ